MFAFSLSSIEPMNVFVASSIAALTLLNTACSKGADKSGRKSSPIRAKAVPQYVSGVSKDDREVKSCMAGRCDERVDNRTDTWPPVKVARRKRSSRNSSVDGEWAE